ncbi:STAS domain-containing protein [Candidatus Laterigemmans baculatus]|uniref:STAS domain-containing protein n=1 Tax=Candidatus Laterigemmans baculatus TaxID=2770505 RepID=UPI0013DA2367|nr:STAS domain-containing protein [Candidatus Laterigemmans baculatus]
MAGFERLVVVDKEDISVVRFVDRKIIDASEIEQLGAELLSLVDIQQRKRLLLNFEGVEFLSSAALNKLITLHTRVKRAGGTVRICNLHPQIREVFAITRLDRMFEIASSESAGLAMF